MKSNFIIKIQGRGSESREDIAKDIKNLMIGKGYGNVSISGEDNKQPYDGFSIDESIEIRID